jgi:hypothetical protein
MRDMRRLRSDRRGLSAFTVILLLALIGVILIAIVRRARDRPVIVHTSGGVTTPPASNDGLPVATVRQKPVSPGFEGCPPEGDGGDRELNYLKNRVDSTRWKPAAFESVLQLRSPAEVTRRTRAEWTRSDSASISRYEGLPVEVEGYFVGAKQEGPEATNCHGAEGAFRDWHIWLGEEPGRDRRRSIVVETTPSVRAIHPEWSLSVIHQLARDSTPVRVSGWLLFDQEHPEQLGKTRGTLWEIHPVMRIEIRRGGRWIPIDLMGSY